MPETIVQNIFFKVRHRIIEPLGAWEIFLALDLEVRHKLFFSSVIFSLRQ
jgi:hypothetical protein